MAAPTPAAVGAAPDIDPTQLTGDEFFAFINSMAGQPSAAAAAEPRLDEMEDLDAQLLALQLETEKLQQEQKNKDADAELLALQMAFKGGGGSGDEDDDDEDEEEEEDSSSSEEDVQILWTPQALGR
jgi:hypothetical protein